MRIVFAIFFVFVALVAAVAIAVTPLSNAKARNMDARNAGLARIANAEAQAAEARARQQQQAAALAAQERAAVSPWLAVAGKVGIATLVVILAVGGASLATVTTAVAYAQVQQNREIARLPVTRQIAERAFVFKGEDGRYWLLDSMTGRRALLSSAADVDALRAGIVREQIVLQELGKTAVEISRHNRNGNQPAMDWLFSEALSRIGDRLESHN